MNVIGPNIKIIRERRGWTQDQLTAKCNLLGWNISRGTLAKIEAKVRRITDIEIVLMSHALDASVSELFDGVTK